jgi:hypothetical protein
VSVCTSLVQGKAEKLGFKRNANSASVISLDVFPLVSHLSFNLGRKIFRSLYMMTYLLAPMNFRIMFRANAQLGRAMAQAVSRRPLTAEAWVRSWVSACGISGGQSGTGTGLSPSTSVFSCQFYSTGAPLLGKMKKLIIFITGLHNKPLGCGASVASAAWPFITQRNAQFILCSNVALLDAEKKEPKGISEFQFLHRFDV